VLDKAQQAVYWSGARRIRLWVQAANLRKLIDEGWIGVPVAATAFMMCHGHESWHPDPEFYYQKAAAPCLIWAVLSHRTGQFARPVCRVTAMTRISFPERTITSAKKYGTRIQVEVPVVTGLLEFESGVIGTIHHDV